MSWFFAGGMVNNVALYVIVEFLAYRVNEPITFLAVNLPYALVAAAFAWRVRSPQPFHRAGSL